MRPANILENPTVHVKAKISALWASVMFCYAYGDLIAFYVPGGLQKIMTGKMGLGRRLQSCCWVLRSLCQFPPS
jgi:hypothetical protein